MTEIVDEKYGITTDSSDYDILIDAVKDIRNVDGFTCEIGMREGGGSYHIMKTLKDTNQKKIHIGIDPFGNIDYVSWEKLVNKLDYSNQMKRKMLKNIYNFCFDNDQEFLFFPLEDTEFFERYANGIPIYNEDKKIMNEYSLVFFDGPHATTIVKTEIDFFVKKLSKNGYFVFDDITQYYHMKVIDPYLKYLGFEQVKIGTCKASYKKLF